jgi:hypothetical protein
LKAGLAWYYREYERDVPPDNRQVYERAEAEARSAGAVCGRSRIRNRRGNTGIPACLQQISQRSNRTSNPARSSATRIRSFTTCRIARTIQNQQRKTRCILSLKRRRNGPDLGRRGIAHN